MSKFDEALQHQQAAAARQAQEAQRQKEAARTTAAETRARKAQDRADEQQRESAERARKQEDVKTSFLPLKNELDASASLRAAGITTGFTTEGLELYEGDLRIGRWEISRKAGLIFNEQWRLVSATNSDQRYHATTLEQAIDATARLVATELQKRPSATQRSMAILLGLAGVAALAYMFTHPFPQALKFQNAIANGLVKAGMWILVWGWVLAIYYCWTGRTDMSTYHHRGRSKPE